MPIVIDQRLRRIIADQHMVDPPDHDGMTVMIEGHLSRQKETDTGIVQIGPAVADAPARLVEAAVTVAWAAKALRHVALIARQEIDSEAAGCPDWRV